MDNFIFHNPTRLIFGKGMIAQLSQQIPADKRIMITFGGGSVKTNGVYEQVIQALEGRDYTEFWGIESNPDISTLKKAIESGKEKNIDFLLAVGGGSVIDGTKLISAGIPYDGDAWELVKKGSVKTNGVYEQVIQALEGRDYTEFWGIESNPDISTLKKAIESGKEKNIDFLLAVGGGSVIDGTKLISAGIPYDGDAWELVKKGSAQNTIPLGTVLTIPATGSEMNNGAVISCRETHEKYPFFSSHPVFSILDPTVTFSLPDYQIACGLADTFVHVMEQYMTKTNESYLMDRWSESILRTLVQIAPQIKENKQDYHLMSEFMMSATMALNGFIAMGVSEDWATHMIGHELTALHGMTHGQTLAIVFPGTLRTLADKKRDKILQYGERIWGVTSGVPSVRVSLTIEKTEEFFRNLGLKTRLDEAGIGDDTIEEIVRRFNERGAAYGEDGDVTGEVARRILQNCKSKKETTDTEGTSMKTVILTSFKSDVRAHMLQDLLKNEGIESMLQGEYTAQVLAYIPGMEIKVLVFEKDYARAFEILKASFPEKV